MNNVRIFFAKTGDARYISHLDLMRAMTRAIKRSALPIWYTEGFNPHIYLTFSLPISLGYEGLAESFDFRLEQEVPMERVKSALSQVMPPGITVISAGEPVYAAKDITLGAYQIALPGENLLQPVTAFLARPSIPCAKTSKKGKTTTFDLATQMQVVSLVDKGGVVELDIILPAGSQLNISPGLFLEALSPELPPGVLPAVCRKGLMIEDGTPFA